MAKKKKKDNDITLIPGKDSGLDVKVEILATKKFKFKWIIIGKSEGETHVILVRYKKKDDPAYVWDPSLSWLSENQVIPFLLFLKENNMEDELEKQIKAIIKGVKEGDQRSIRIISIYNTVEAISELGPLFQMIAQKDTSETILEKQRLSTVRAKIYPSEKKS